MKANTLVSGFGLLSIFIFFSLIGQFLFSSFAKHEPVSIYRVFPVSSIPIVVRMIKGEDLHPAETHKTTPPVKLILQSGEEISGKLVGEEPNWVILQIDESDVGFRRSEILDMSFGQSEESAA